MTLPNNVNWDAGTTVTSPVTHTDVADVNSASVNAIGCVLLTGRDKSAAPSRITPRKPAAVTRSVFHLVFLFFLIISSPDSILLEEARTVKK